MRNSILVSFGALAFASAGMVAAQDAPSDAPLPPPHMSMPDTPDAAYEANEAQQALYDAWPEDQQLAYNEWTGAEQAYFWSLPESRQQTYWNLTPGARAALGEMDESGREAAWSSLEERLSSEAEAPPASEVGPLPPPPPPPPPEPEGEQSNMADSGADTGAYTEPVIANDTATDMPDDNHGAAPEPR